MSQDTFRPFSDYLEKEQALSVLQQAVAGADDGEIFLERSRSEVLSLDDGRVKTASYDASEGFGLRAVRGEVAGYAHSTEISEKSLLRAAETARLAVGAGGGTLAGAPARSNVKLYGDADPMVPFEEMGIAGDALVAAGFETYGHVMRGTGHGIAPDGLGAALGFLKARLPA